MKIETFDIINLPKKVRLESGEYSIALIGGFGLKMNYPSSINIFNDEENIHIKTRRFHINKFINGTRSSVKFKFSIKKAGNYNLEITNPLGIKLYRSRLEFIQFFSKPLPLKYIKLGIFKKY